MKLSIKQQPLGGRHKSKTKARSLKPYTGGPLPKSHQDSFGGRGKEPDLSYEDLMAQLAAALARPAAAPSVTVNVPKPKALQTKGTAVGGSARGVKARRSKASKAGYRSRGTRALNRRQRAASMKINNLNI